MKDVPQEILLTRLVYELDLSGRVANALMAAGIRTIGELVGYTEYELMRVPALGIKSVREITQRLAAHHLALRGSTTRSATGTDDPMLRIAEVRTRCGLSTGSIFMLIRRAGFPQPVPLTQHLLGWRQSEIDEWIARRRPVGSPADHESNTA